MSLDRFKPCNSKSDICRAAMAYNFNERLRRGKVDVGNATCLKNDQGQRRICRGRRRSRDAGLGIRAVPLLQPTQRCTETLELSQSCLRS
jgi:hypothetical protein